MSVVRIIGLFAGILMGLFCCHTAVAADDVVVRIAAIPENPWVGQKVVLQLDVLGKDGWAQLKKVYGRDVRGGYLKRFESQGTRLNETIDGGSYTGQRYEFFFFPQQAGPVTIGAVDIDVEVKQWGADAGNDIVHQSVPELNLEVRPVEGVPTDQVIVSTPALSAAQTWEPELTDLKAGDAVTRTIILKAQDLSGMVLPAFDGGPVPGVGVYPASPRVDDSYDRGELTGSREEAITYVMEQPGSVQVEDFTITWWNLDTEALETLTLEGKSFTVEAVPGIEGGQASSGGSPEPAGRLRVPAIIVALLGLAAIISWRYRSAFRTRYRAWKDIRYHREESYFKRVSDAAGSGDPLRLMNAALQWLDRIHEGENPARLDEFVAEYGTEEDLKCIQEYTVLDSEGTGASQMRRFHASLASVRRNWLVSREKLHARNKASSLLPPIGINQFR